MLYRYENTHKSCFMILGSNQIQNRLTSWFLRRTASSGGRRVAALSAAVASEIGSVRGDNQDRVAIARGQDFAGRSFILVALCDGIGGMKNGAECAATALGGFFGSFFDEVQLDCEPEQWLSRAAFKSNSAVNAKLEGAGGSTLVAVLISSGGGVYWLSVGDSRVHHSLGTRLTQISVDDTIAGQLGKHVEAGIGQSNLLQFIGMGKQLEPHVSRLETGLQGSVLLTSDGVHFINPDWIGQIIGHSPDPGVCVRRLAELAKWCGGPDNASVAMIALDVAVDIPFSEPLYEIWDPFGELQIIIGAEQRLPTGNVGRSVSSPLSPIPKVSVDLACHPETQTKERQDKTKRSRGSRKPKVAAPKPEVVADKDGGSAMEVPQLLMKFPNKAS